MSELFLYKIKKMVSFVKKKKSKEKTNRVT